MTDCWRSCGNSGTGSDYELYVVADQNADERIRLDQNHWLLAKTTDGLHVEFAVFGFHDGPATRNGEVVSPEHHIMIMHGSGPSGSLRECRHTWWGENGYVHYLHFAAIEAALRELRRWFDGD
jgi:hypothetical protein